MGWEPLPQDRSTTHGLPDALDRVRRSLGLARADALETIEAAWPSLVGRRLAPGCRPASLREGRLVVVASDPAVADHLRWQVSDLRDAVNQVCDGEVVSDVRIQVSGRSASA